MIFPTIHLVAKPLIDEALLSLPSEGFKVALNKPSGDFFYDPWIIKDEFKGTIWEKILTTLGNDRMGEARIINLDIKTCYTMHADIDDRWHLSFKDSQTYLVDLDEQKMYNTNKGMWYFMDAGKLHSAVNFSDEPRYQLVVRKLLAHNELKNRLTVTVALKNVPNNFRYILDTVISPWLNVSVKNSILDNFKVIDEKNFKFDLEKSEIENFKSLIKKSNLDIELTYDPIF